MKFFCFRHAHEAGMFTVPKASAAFREAKDETEEASKPGEEQDEQIEDQQDIDSAEEATVIFELSSSSEDE